MIMSSKFFFHLLILILTVNSSLAQDTICMRTDQRIACKVLEVTPTVVKYKRWELMDGPLFIENKSLVARIKYSNGFVDAFSETRPAISTENEMRGNHTVQKKYPDLTTIAGERTIYFYDDGPIGESNMHNLLMSLNNPKITEEVRRAEHFKKMGYFGFLTIPFGVAGVVCAANAIGFLPFSDKAKIEFGAASALFFSGAAFAIGTTFYFDSKNRQANKRAIQLYRQNYLEQ
jgi:hypothetical protein